MLSTRCKHGFRVLRGHIERHRQICGAFASFCPCRNPSNILRLFVSNYLNYMKLDSILTFHVMNPKLLHTPPRILRLARTFAVLLLSLTSLAVVSGCKKEENASVKLCTAKVERGNLTQTVVATGRIQPLHQIEIRSKSGGTVRNIFVEEGDWVKKGQKLLEISPEASPSEQVRAQAELHTATVDPIEALRYE